MRNMMKIREMWEIKYDFLFFLFTLFAKMKIWKLEEDELFVLLSIILNQSSYLDTKKIMMIMWWLEVMIRGEERARDNMIKWNEHDNICKK